MLKYFAQCSVSLDHELESTPHLSCICIKIDNLYGTGKADEATSTCVSDQECLLANNTIHLIEK